MKKWLEKLKVKSKAFYGVVFGDYGKAPWKGFRPQSGWREFGRHVRDTYILKWVFYGCLATLAAWAVYGAFGNPYGYESMKEGLAPRLWNSLVMVGMVFSMMGIVLKIATERFSQIPGNSQMRSIGQYFDRSSSALLKFASEIGAFGYGIILGMGILAIIGAGFDKAKIVLMLGGGILLGCVLCFNLVVWWLSYVISNEFERPPLMKYWQQKSYWFRFVFASFGFVFFSVATLYKG